ncbi:MAG: peptidase C14 [Aureispira sp.]|nr:peptidase C14 [Aureispira sp.]
MKTSLYLKFLGFTLLSSLWLSTASAQDTGCTTGDCENGKGRYIFPNLDKYIGEFKGAALNGRGAYYFKNGDIYKGQFKDNKREGYGTFTWKNGDIYIGEYLNNQRHGEGTYIYVDGTEQKGVWVNGAFQEPVVEEPVVDTTENVIVDPFAENADSTNQGDGQYLKALANIDTTQARTALVIGNSAYRKSPLKNPKNDAIAVAEELQRSGFDVIMYTNVGQKAAKLAIREFGQLLKERGGVGLFFYAGHGLQADGRNYLVPTDANIKKAHDIEFESVDLGRVLVELEYAENDMNIVILDACRDNPYKEEFKKSKYNSYNGLASIGSAPYNSFIAFSTAPGSVALDGKGENGLYTQELLKSMRQDNVGLEEVFKKVRKNVRKASMGKQIPWETSSVEDDFYFKK